MADPPDQLTREDAIYAAIDAYVRRNAFGIALVAPFLLVALLLPDGGGLNVLLVLIIYLAEAIAYAGMRRRQGVRLADPVDSLSAAARWAWRLVLIGITAVSLVIVNAILSRIGL
jgi:hypothetical protein